MQYIYIYVLIIVSTTSSTTSLSCISPYYQPYRFNSSCVFMEWNGCISSINTSYRNGKSETLEKVTNESIPPAVIHHKGRSP